LGNLDAAMPRQKSTLKSPRSGRMEIARHGLAQKGFLNDIQRLCRRTVRKGSAFPAAISLF
jgi:hypothetical protein